MLTRSPRRSPPGISTVSTSRPRALAACAGGFPRRRVARNLLAADKGARFVQVTDTNWDHHSNIYGAQGISLFTKGKALDDALGALLSDMSTRNGSTPGKTLLDETLVVVLGEFGRTVGPITPNGGRDHYLRM